MGASTFMPGSGPVTRRVTVRPPVAATRASTVPSPPSAMGHASMVIDGSTERMPAAIDSHTAAAERQPLNLSGARTIFIAAQRLTARAYAAARASCQKCSPMRPYARDGRAAKTPGYRLSISRFGTTFCGRWAGALWPTLCKVSSHSNDESEVRVRFDKFTIKAQEAVVRAQELA